MILYHGTTTPVDVIRSKGLRAHSPEMVLDFLLMRVRNPLAVANDLRKALTRGKKPFWEVGTVRFSAYRRDVMEYASAPPEVLSHVFLDNLPTPLALEAITALMEVRDGRVFGKVVTVDIPSPHDIDPSLPLTWEEYMEPQIKGFGKRSAWSEIAFRGDVGPQYITDISYAYEGTLRKSLRETVTWWIEGGLEPEEPGDLERTLEVVKEFLKSR